MYEMSFDPSDADLVLRIAQGHDPEAESEVCRRMGPRIRLYGLRHLRDHAAAEDLMQQVLIVVLQALRTGSLREPDKLASFVLGTSRMTILEIRRGSQRREKLLEQWGPEALAPSSTWVPRLDHDRLHGCVQGLKERERWVIVMSFYDEKTSIDVAQFLGVSEANVRVIRHRAIHLLRRCMGESE